MIRINENIEKIWKKWFILKQYSTFFIYFKGGKVMKLYEQYLELKKNLMFVMYLKWESFMFYWRMIVINILKY